jgi:hypothetical protein
MDGNGRLLSGHRQGIFFFIAMRRNTLHSLNPPALKKIGDVRCRSISGLDESKF